MRILASFFLFPAMALAAFFASSAYLEAHHNTQAEFGTFGSDTMYIEARIVRIYWGNPHIYMDIETPGGEVPAGENWRLQSHPIGIKIQYGFAMEEFAVGDDLKLIGWRHIRGQPMIWPRAMQVNDGPMKSNLRFTDMIDIAEGTFEEMNIVPAANLNGSPPQRAGEETVQKLAQMGLLDDEGLMIWPPR